MTETDHEADPNQPLDDEAEEARCEEQAQREAAEAAKREEEAKIEADKASFADFEIGRRAREARAVRLALGGEDE